MPPLVTRECTPHPCGHSCNELLNPRNASPLREPMRAKQPLRLRRGRPSRGTCMFGSGQDGTFEDTYWAVTKCRAQYISVDFARTSQTALN